MITEPINTDNKTKLTVKIKNFWVKYTGKLRNEFLCFVQKSWKGAAIGGCAALLIYTFFYMFPSVETGLPRIVDFLIVAIILTLLSALIFYLCKWLFNLLKNINTVFLAVLFTLYLLWCLIFEDELLQYFILFELVCGSLIAFALTLKTKKFIPVILISLVVIANLSVLYLLVRNVEGNVLEVRDEYWNQDFPAAQAANFENPALEGNYQVKTLFYGSGKDKHRSEYGKDADLITDSVDATKIFDQSSGFGNTLRKWYWGFNSKDYPINGRVWYPEGDGPFPLVLIVHGNHSMMEYSDGGYDYLGELLASRGYIFVSVDENFINGGWMGDYGQDENFTRGWLMLKHLENWRKWSGETGNPFYGKVDMENISLIGHSRGGAAVAVAAEINKLQRFHGDANQVFDFNFNLKSIVQIAPVDTYSPKKGEPLVVKDIDYLLLHGSHDEDVYTIEGNKVYNRMKFTDSAYHFKSAIFIYRANHAYFNTSWDKDFNDMSTPWFINMNAFISGDEQREVAKLYISAFLDATLKGKKEYLPVFRDYRNVKKYLPKNYYISQFEDSGFKYIADYEEDYDVITATLPGASFEGENLKTWKENSLTLRNQNSSTQNNSGVYLGWDTTDTTITGVASYTLKFDQDALSTVNNFPEKLFFFIANNHGEHDTVNFTIELVCDSLTFTKDFNDFMVLPAALKSELSKNSFLMEMRGDDTFERVLQYVELPLTLFWEDNAFNASDIQQIRFIFDKTEKGEIILDKIGIH